MIAAVIVEDIDHHNDTPGAVEIRSYPDGSVGGIAFICPAAASVRDICRSRPTPSSRAGTGTATVSTRRLRLRSYSGAGASGTAF